MSYSEEYLDESMFEKPRGERRWLGREHHRGKERLHNAVKDRTFIEKTVRAEQPIGNKVVQKLNNCTNDELQLNVVYSMDKKNRWRGADTISLMKATPETVNTEVVEKNALEKCGIMHPNKSVFAVHSKQVDAESTPGEFDIRSATSSGKGQDYSNFLPKSRELSKKVDPRKKDASEEDVAPVVSYNIYRTHPSQEVVGKEMFKAKVVSKSGRHRLNKKLDLEVYSDEDYSENEESDAEESFYPNRQTSLNLSEFVVEHRDKQCRKKKDSLASYEIVDDQLLPYRENAFSDLMDIPTFLKEEGSTFEEADVVFQNQKDTLRHQIGSLREEEDIIIKDLRPGQYLIDVSKWCELDELKDGETNTVILFSHIRNNQYHVIVNSTIPSHPSKRGTQYLKKLISSALSIREAMTRITAQLLTNRKTIETMKLSSSFYGRKKVSEMIQDSGEWENQLMEMEWPNKNYHYTWANSSKLSRAAGKLEWDDLKAMVRKEGKMKTLLPTEQKCETCHQKKYSHNLFSVENGLKAECTGCLRDQFYRELRARRLPIDLQTDTADELEYLPTFIPLTVLNLYIRMVAEMIYKDLGAAGSFEKCRSCKSAIYFEETVDDLEKKMQNRSCPCGYSWCNHCKKVPHWPMDCQMFADWEEKWLLRYSIMHAQGSGTETLLQITCCCGKAIYNVLLSHSYVWCPSCRFYVYLDTMNTRFANEYVPYRPRYRKLVQQGYVKIAKEGLPRMPRGTVYTSISKIPMIRESVINVCGAARDVRFDVGTSKRAVHRERLLIRRKILEHELVEDLLGTSSYIVENVTAWMYVTNQHNRKIENVLKDFLEDRKLLVQLLEGEDQKTLTECIQKLSKGVQAVISFVYEKKTEDK